MTNHLDTILTRLGSYYPKAIAPGLSRTIDLLKKCGDPHLKLPPVIHVAGTNGKGSIIAFLRAISRAHHLKPHIMTSPHLVKFNERLVVGDVEISDDMLTGVLTRVEKINGDDQITFFEITTVAGFQVFCENAADLVLLETGMGGKWDSTNVVPNPAVTVISVISYDHQQFLGDNLKSIAAEKAGIMKTGSPCVIAPQTYSGIGEGVLNVFENKAQTIGTPLYIHGDSWHIEKCENGFHIVTGDKKTFYPQPNLLGDHQINNAATAIIAWQKFCDETGVVYNHDAVCMGIQNAMWPARLQVLNRGPLKNLLPDGFTLMIDGGHNDTGGVAIADYLARTGKAHVICGMLSTKNPVEFITPIKPHILSLSAITIPFEKLSYTAQDLSQKIDAPAYESLEDAIKNIVQNYPPSPILICGSLYLAGYILRENG